MITIYNVAVRKLKDGSFSGSFTIPAGAKRIEIVQFEDAESCDLYESGRTITADEQASEKLSSLIDDLKGLMNRHAPVREVATPFFGDES